MIWNSIPLMTAIDLLIIAVTIYAIWRCRLVGPSKRPSAPQTGLRLIVLGLNCWARRSPTESIRMPLADDGRARC
jgi:hypothetical protein